MATKTAEDTQALRKTTQPLLPISQQTDSGEGYRLFSTFSLPPDQIKAGYESLAESLAEHPVVTLEGFSGVLWEQVQSELESHLAQHNKPTWLSAADAIKSERELEEMLEPYLGGDDPLFGKRYPGTIEDFFDPEKLEQLQNKLAVASEPVIVYGCGSSLVAPDAFQVYLEVPKNEIQYRANAGSVMNLGASTPAPPKEMYKRFYFVDWVILSRHKAALLDNIDIFADTQRVEAPTFTSGANLREALNLMQQSSLRARPWLAPGAWGGQWLQENVDELPPEVNYAWSFELISPENGFVLESSQYLLEVSFDVLMFTDPYQIIGSHAERFGHEFPIRFDYLDTVDGGNLSLQCHPQEAFIKEEFGESFTQDETYYLCECTADAQVYLGFQEDIDPAAFRGALERSQETGEQVEVERFVQTHPANKHDLFLIPRGTVHCSGAGSLVLEISATPYIFTFKMYDWLRLDLDGKPRPLNIARAFENLDFEQRGATVPETLIAQPETLEKTEAYTLAHLPTHEQHFYDIHRIELSGTCTVETGNTCHVLNIVEGSDVRVTTQNGRTEVYRRLETFLIPAAAGHYTLEALGGTAKVVKAFLK